MGSFLIYAGLVLLLAGFLSLLKPLRFLEIHDRRTAAAVLGAGLALALLGASLPAVPVHAVGPRTRLDDFVPDYHFHEVHEVRIQAPAERILRAIRSVTAGEIRFFRALTWIRSPRLGRGSETILAAPAEKPLLDVALHSGFLLLGEEPGRELVVGTVLGRPLEVSRPSPEGFVRFQRPGYCKTAMNFRLREDGDGVVLLTTETRVFATDPSARRRFAVYWRVIYPGSALIRRSWLAAIKRRAENPTL